MKSVVPSVLPSICLFLFVLVCTVFVGLSLEHGDDRETAASVVMQGADLHKAKENGDTMNPPLPAGLPGGMSVDPLHGDTGPGRAATEPGSSDDVACVASNARAAALDKLIAAFDVSPSAEVRVLLVTHMTNVLEAEYAATAIAPAGCRSVSSEQESFVSAVACEVMMEAPDDAGRVRLANFADNCQIHVEKN